MKKSALLVIFSHLFFFSFAQEPLAADTAHDAVAVDVKAAQKELVRHLKAAKLLSAISQSPNFANARKEIDAAFASPVFDKNRAEVYFEAGNVEYNCYEVERNKPAKGGKIDYAVLYPATVRGFDYLSRAYEIYQEGGKGLSSGMRTAMQKKAWTLFNVTDGFRANAAHAFENKDWPTARSCFDLFVSAAGSRIISDYAATNSRIAQQLRLYKNDSIIAHAKYFRAISSIYMNNVDQAIADLEEIKYDGFEQNVVLQELCSLYREKGDDEKFKSLLEEAIEILPSEPWYSRNLVNIYLDRKDYNTASEIIDRLIAVDANNPENLALKGQLVEMQGDDETALEFFERSYAIDPDNCEINSHLGRVWYNRANRLESELFGQRRYDDAARESMPLYIKSASYYVRAFELDEKHLDQTIAKAIRTINYKQFTKAGCENKDALIEQYNAVSRAYGMTEFPR